MAQFIRFVAGEDCDKPIWAPGIISFSRIYQDEGRLDEWAVDCVREILDWLNERLPCPPFTQKLHAGEWTQDAVCWFKDTAQEPICVVRELTDILKHQGAYVRKIRTEMPGEIVYEDEFQIVAETSEFLTLARIV